MHDFVFHRNACKHRDGNPHPSGNPKGIVSTGTRTRTVNRMPQRGIGLQPKVGAPAPTLGNRARWETTATRLWRIRRDGRK